MSLLNQFQGFIGSIGFGFFFYMFFHPLERIVKKSSLLIKGLIVLSFFLLGTYLYFLFLVKYTYGIMNVFYPLSILIGVLFYHMFYFEKFDDFYIRIINKLSLYIKLKSKKLFVIMNKKLTGRKKHGKFSKSKKQNG